MLELYLYVGCGYFKAFCTIVHKFLSGKVHFDFSSAYSIDPQTSEITNPYGLHVIPYGKVDLDREEPYYQCYCPGISKPIDQSCD